MKRRAAGSPCLVRGCENPVAEGQLQCAPCRGGLTPDVRFRRAERETGPRGKPEQAVRLAVRAYYQTAYPGCWIADLEQGYRRPTCPVCGARTGQASSRVTKGTPDLFVLLPGRGIRLVECKSATGRQSPEQKGCEEAAQAADVPYILARSAEDVARFERAWDRERVS